MNRFSTLIVLCVLMTSCSLLKTTRSETVHSSSSYSYCDSIREESDLHSVYYKNILTELDYNDAKYKAKVNAYYVPDSLMYVSVINAGFEIFRAALFQDSLVVINRLEKTVYVQVFADMLVPPLFALSDIELLLNKSKQCNSKPGFHDLELVALDISSEVIKRKLLIRESTFQLHNFEFFNKKNGEFLLGESEKDDLFRLYVNYILTDLEIVCSKPSVAYNVDLSINLSTNRAKYSYFYIQ